MGVEIIILENSDKPSLRVEDFGSNSNLQVHPAESPLDMPSNWERGLSIARGKYLCYLSDKDMFLPGALRRFAQELATGKHEILCFRKAYYHVNWSSLEYCRTTGAVRTEMFNNLLNCFFDNLQYYNHAPMIYTSAVARELVFEIRGNRPRFFIGNSPDLITVILFASHRDHYSQIELTLSVGYMGDWSNGMSSITKGRSGEKIQDFLKLFRRCPYKSIHVPVCLSSAVLESLLVAKSEYPDKLKIYKVDWQNYLKNVHAWIAMMQISEQEKKEELSILASKKCVVPRLEYIRFKYNPRIKALTEKLKAKLFWRPLIMIGKIKNSLFPNSSGLLNRFKQLSGHKPKELKSVLPVEVTAPCWSDQNTLRQPCNSIGEALEIANRMNCYTNN